MHRVNRLRPWVASAHMDYHRDQILESWQFFFDEVAALSFNLGLTQLAVPAV
jgi:hypothetical protein